ncbi:MAG: ATP-binding protein [Nitrospiraceae bacterium]|nr:ATP-binding protein [Nitrospiraceae bacterium]
MTAYHKRDIAGAVLVALENMPVVAVTGMRQSGKSTFLRNEAGLHKRRYVTLDDLAQLAAARESPDRFVESDEPLAIDEVQKCPELLTAIKRRVDRHRSPGQYLLSGSANFALLKGITESLAGRAIYFTMHPFTRREQEGHVSARPFIVKLLEDGKPSSGGTIRAIGERDVLSGGMPSVCLGEVKDRNIWFKGYEQTYLERDLRQFSRLENIVVFKNLMQLAALRTGRLLSPSELGRDAKLNAVTTARYLSLLETSFLAWRLTPFLKNRASRIIKSPKMYLSDSGLACWLAGVHAFKSDPSRGAMLETYVAQNLAGILAAHLANATLHYWNVQGRYEVDFVIESGRRCIALEVKSAARWEERDLTGLKAFLAATPGCVAAVLAYNGTETVPLGEHLWAVPLSRVIS